MSGMRVLAIVQSGVFAAVVFDGIVGDIRLAGLLACSVISGLVAVCWGES